MNYSELLSAYNNVLAENHLLKQENIGLKLRIGLEVELPQTHLSEIALIANTATVTQKSDTNEKVKLFMSLFRGRNDVFARRWYSQKSEKSGYQPVCKNEWIVALCDKKKYKCRDCPNRHLMPLTENDIVRHLTGSDPYGRDVVGIYPMVADENCYFLAVDFDDGDYRKDANAFRSACADNGVPVAIERSRSGDGAHAWIFFEESVPAHVARKLGSGLLTYAMNIRSDMKFNSYDRLFPNQDNMPTGGFGNLIALPLQGNARKNANSVFVDDEFSPYSDQWAYLSQVKKLTVDRVEALIGELCKNSDLGVLVKDNVDNDENKPWESKKTYVDLSANDFPASLNITRANMLYVEKHGISEKALNRIKRLGAFKNPEFYKAQAMRLPIFDKPRIISVAENAGEYIGIPRGMEKDLIKLLENADAEYIITDKRNHGTPINIAFGGNLYGEQQQAADALLSHDIGVLSATTAFGKTVIGAYVIAQNAVNTLVVVHTAALLSQWRKSLEEFLSAGYEIQQQSDKRGRKKDASIIGCIGGGKNERNGFIDIAIMNSLFENCEVKPFVRNYGQIIVDECHHVSAVNFERILKYATAKYVYGLTATPTRRDGHHPIIFMQCGGIAYTVDAESQAKKRPFEHILIPRFTSFKKMALIDETNPIKTFTDVVNDELRNRLITNDIIEAVHGGKTPIILTERADHVNILAKILDGNLPNIILLVGKMSAKEKREAMQRLHNVPDNEPMVVVATGKYVGEGFDFPRLDTLFLAMPISWKGKVAQYAGRLHRAYEGKKEVLIYDYIDVHIPVLERMYHKRAKSYVNLGYKARVLEQSCENTTSLYDNRSFLSKYNNDITIASKEIIIVSPYMRRNRLFQTVQVLLTAILNGVSVAVVTRPPEDFKGSERDAVLENIEYLRSSNICVILKSGIHQKFTVIDGHIVWYGSINFLSFGKNEESVMRFDNFDIGGELRGIL